jgi:hypothetical protein
MRRHPLSPGPTPTDPQPLPAGTDIAGAFLAAVAERHGGITLTRDDVLRFSRRLVVIEPAVIDPHALTLRVVEDTPAAVARHWATRAMDAAQAGDNRAASEALREFGVIALSLDVDTAETLRGMLTPILGPRVTRIRPVESSTPAPSPGPVPITCTPTLATTPAPTAGEGLDAAFRPEGG